MINILIFIVFSSSEFFLRLLIIELIVRNVYSDLFFSKILFLFCVTKFTDVQVLIIISNDLTLRLIFVSPKDKDMLFFPRFERFSLADFSKVGKYKFD